MKAFRVMVNELGRGTGVHVDRIPTEKEAKKLCVKMRKLKDGKAYFTQEYEESRVQ